MDSATDENLLTAGSAGSEGGWSGDEACPAGAQSANQPLCRAGAAGLGTEASAAGAGGAPPPWEEAPAAPHPAAQPLSLLDLGGPAVSGLSSTAGAYEGGLEELSDVETEDDEADSLRCLPPQPAWAAAAPAAAAAAAPLAAGWSDAATQPAAAAELLPAGPADAAAEAAAQAAEAAPPAAPEPAVAEAPGDLLSLTSLEPEAPAAELPESMRPPEPRAESPPAAAGAAAPPAAALESPFATSIPATPAAEPSAAAAAEEGAFGAEASPPATPVRGLGPEGAAGGRDAEGRPGQPSLPREAAGWDMLEAAEQLEHRLAASSDASPSGAAAGASPGGGGPLRAGDAGSAAYQQQLLLASLASQLEGAAGGGWPAEGASDGRGAVVGREAAARAFLSPAFEPLFRGGQQAQQGVPTVVAKYLGIVAVGTSGGSVHVLMPGVPAPASAGGGGQGQLPRLVEVRERGAAGGGGGGGDRVTALCLGQHGGSLLLVAGHASGSLRVWELKTHLLGERAGGVVLLGGWGRCDV